MRFAKVILLSLSLTALTATGVAATLEIDPSQSKIEVSVSALMDSFVGRLEKFSAEVDCNPETAVPCKAEVSFDFADLKTGNQGRDAAMLKWLEYQDHPKALFQLTGWKQQGGTNLVLGELTLHGVKRSIESPVLIKKEGAVWDIAGTAEFDYRDFQLPKIRKALILTVNPHLKVSYHLSGKLPVAH